jgi:hypothetical protein
MRKMSAVSMLLLLGVVMLGCNAAKQAAPQQPPPQTLTIAGNWAVTVSNAVCSTDENYAASGILNTCSTGKEIGTFNMDLEPFQINDGPLDCEIPFPNSPWEFWVYAGPDPGVSDCGFANIDGYGSISDVTGTFPAAPWGVMLGEGPTVQNSFNAELALVFTNGDLLVFGGVYLDDNGTWTATGVIGPCDDVGGSSWLEWPITTPDCSGATYPTMIVNAVYVTQQ